ncbi:MAG: flagellar biosynthetic protein FliO [Oscillospiraceae bacterium]|nr:flagellar biosynthetic protein FliO [Oscillospiraceae bacterium]
MQQPLQVALSIIGIVVIIVGAYYVTYFIGVKSSRIGRSRNRNRNIRLLDRFSISKDKSFCIVEIAGKVYVIGVTNQSMTLLDTLDPEALADAAPEQGKTVAWRTASGGGYIDRMTKKLAAFLAQRMGKTPMDSGKTAASGASFEATMRAAREKDTREDV